MKHTGTIYYSTATRRMRNETTNGQNSPFSQSQGNIKSIRLRMSRAELHRYLRRISEHFVLTKWYSFTIIAVRWIRDHISPEIKKATINAFDSSRDGISEVSRIEYEKCDKNFIKQQKGVERR